MKTLSMLSFVVLLVHLAPFPARGASYTNDLHGLTIDFPPGWEITTNAPRGLAIAAYVTNQTCLAFVRLETWGSGSALGQWVDRHLATMAKRYPNAEQGRTTNINNIVIGWVVTPYKKRKRSYWQLGPPHDSLLTGVMTHYFLTYHGDRTYHIHCVCRDDPEYTAEAEQLMHEAAMSIRLRKNARIRKEYYREESNKTN